MTTTSRDGLGTGSHCTGDRRGMAKHLVLLPNPPAIAVTWRPQTGDRWKPSKHLSKAPETYRVRINLNKSKKLQIPTEPKIHFPLGGREGGDRRSRFTELSSLPLMLALSAWRWIALRYESCRVAQRQKRDRLGLE